LSPETSGEVKVEVEVKVKVKVEVENQPLIASHQTKVEVEPG
jgi:hypothetical protein